VFCDGRERGQTTSESAVLIGLLAIGLIVAIVFFRGTISDAFRGDGSEASGAFRPPAGTCDSHYAGGCVPPYPPDVSCEDLQALGITSVRIIREDPHGLDPDGDGIGCG
jgi:hypothetical protein